MKYIPENLETCPDHPLADVRRFYDADFYVWPDGRRSAPMHERNETFECAECRKPLRMLADHHQGG
jgi:hypothetical protein